MAAQTIEVSDSTIGMSPSWSFSEHAGIYAPQPRARMVNIIATMNERHSKKPDELYDMIEHCSPAPFLELFARSTRRGWLQWGDEIPPVNALVATEKVSPRPM